MGAKLAGRCIHRTIVAIGALLWSFSPSENELVFMPTASGRASRRFGIVAEQWYAAQAGSISRLGDLLYQARAPQISLDLVLFLFLLGVAAIVLGSRRALAEALPSVSVSAAGLIFVVLPFSAVVRLDGVDVVGPKLLLFTLVFVWVGDTAAYFVGRNFGRMKMSPPQVSP